MKNPNGEAIRERTVAIEIDGVVLEGDLSIPRDALGLVIFAHGSGSSRFSPRNRAVARVLHQGRFATLLLDLLTADEEDVDAVTTRLRFDVSLLAHRLMAATMWAQRDRETHALPAGYFGASTGAAAALVAASRLDGIVRAIVSRGGRPDLAGQALALVRAPTLLIVGGYDEPVLDLNRDALNRLRGDKRLEIVPRATHLFEEPGALEQVARLARSWFEHHLAAQPIHAGPPHGGW
jgi:pimeloyl-ACP methyl ester carboxylesterase